MFDLHCHKTRELELVRFVKTRQFDTSIPAKRNLWSISDPRGELSSGIPLLLDGKFSRQIGNVHDFSTH